MVRNVQKLFTQFIVTGFTLICFSIVHAYEVAVGLGSTAAHSISIALGDGSKWPYVAENSWGPLANHVPIGLLTREQQTAIYNNFRQKRAISEIPYPTINWNGSQGDIDFIEFFGFTVPYVFVLYEYHERVSVQGQATADALAEAGVVDSMLTRGEILRLKARFPDKKIIMNTRSWVRNQAHLETVTDILDGVTIEYIPHNTVGNIAQHVAPFAKWAHDNNKILLVLMPPLPDDYLEDRYVFYVKRMIQTIYNENKNLLPTGWLRSNNFIFVPANYTFGESKLHYVPEDAENTVLAAVKQLLLMREELDAGPLQPVPESRVIDSILPLLLFD